LFEYLLRTSSRVVLSLRWGENSVLVSEEVLDALTKLSA
jgi:hypothetical protein